MTEHGDDTYRYKDIRLNFSSNVYNHFNHEGLFRHLGESMKVVTSYPEPAAEPMEWAISEHLNVPKECVMVTNGATEAIYLIAQTFAGTDDKIAQPTFSEYANACRLAGYGKGTKTQWMCNPNNPTGIVKPKDEVTAMIEAAPDTVFILDHSYDCFTSKEILSAKEALRYDNVLMIHSMTKEYAIPGLRLGYVTGNAKLLEKIRERRMPWSVNALAICAGQYLIEHEKDYVIPVEMLCHERERVARELASTGMIEITDSDTHLLLCKLKDGSAGEMKEFLANNCGILIRHAGNFEGLDDAWFRIAVQQPAENDELIAAIVNWLKR